MFIEKRVRVSATPVVDLTVAEIAGPTKLPLLVVHGGPDWDHTYLREPLDQIAGRHRALFPDLRGCGRSTRGLPDECYTWDAVVADLIALLDALHVEQADVLGFSTGGLIAQRLTLSAPARVRRLVVASSSVIPLPPDAFQGWQERDIRIAEAELQRELGLEGSAANRADAVADAVLNVWQAEALPDYLSRIAAIQFSGDWWRPWKAGLLPPVRVPDAEQRLASLGLPVLLLHGRQDMTFPAELAEIAAARNPAFRAEILDDAGHMAHIDQPQPWLTAVTAFLA